MTWQDPDDVIREAHAHLAAAERLLASVRDDYDLENDAHVVLLDRLVENIIDLENTTGTMSVLVMVDEEIDDETRAKLEDAFAARFEDSEVEDTDG